MKPTQRGNPSKQLINEIQLARLQATKAGTRLESARELARLAKRRRKEARIAARLAKKEVRRAKKEFAEVTEALAVAEEKFNAAVERSVRQRKLLQARPRAKAAAASKRLSRKTGARRLSKPASGKVRTSAKQPPSRLALRASHKRGVVDKRVTKKTSPTARAPSSSPPKRTTVAAAPVVRAVRHRKLAPARLRAKPAVAGDTLSRTSGVKRVSKRASGNVRSSTLQPPTRPEVRASHKPEVAGTGATKMPSPAVRAPLSMRPEKTAVAATPVVSVPRPILVARDFDVTQQPATGAEPGDPLAGPLPAS